MLFRLSDAEPDIGSMLQTWLARQEVFAPVFELCFAMRYHPSMYNEVQFLLYAQAIETTTSVEAIRMRSTLQITRFGCRKFLKLFRNSGKSGFVHGCSAATIALSISGFAT